MRSAFVFLYTFLTLLFPAHASASGGEQLTKIRPGTTAQVAYHSIFAEERNYNNNNIGLDNDGLDDDANCVVELDNDEVNNENNSQASGRKRGYLSTIPAADILFQKNIHNKAGIITSPEQRSFRSGTPIILFISQFRL
jgi:hypothetical protein